MSGGAPGGEGAVSVLGPLASGLCSLLAAPHWPPAEAVPLQNLTSFSLLLEGSPDSQPWPDLGDGVGSQSALAPEDAHLLPHRSARQVTAAPSAALALPRVVLTSSPHLQCGCWTLSSAVPTAEPGTSSGPACLAAALLSGPGGGAGASEPVQVTRCGLTCRQRARLCCVHCGMSASAWRSLPHVAGMPGA